MAFDSVDISEGSGQPIAGVDGPVGFIQAMSISSQTDDNSQVPADQYGLATKPVSILFSGTVDSGSPNLQVTADGGWLSVQLVKTGTITVYFDSSNDGSNWHQTSLRDNGLTTSAFATTTSLWCGRAEGRFFRVRHNSGVGSFAVTGYVYPSVSGGNTITAIPTGNQTVSGSITGTVTATGPENEDVAATSGDSGMPPLFVRSDSITTATTSANGDYTIGAADRYGRQSVSAIPLVIDQISSFTLNTIAIAATEAQGQTVTIQQVALPAGSPAYALEGSNDSNTWVNIPVWPVDTAWATQPVPNWQAVGHWTSSIPTRYFRVRVSNAGSSGTGQIVAVCHPLPFSKYTLGETTVTGTVTTAGSGTFIVGGVAAADAAVSGSPHVIAGSSNSSIPTAMSADSDVTRLWVRRTGSVVTTVETTATIPTLTSTAGSASTVSIIALNTARRKIVIVNDSTAILYVNYGAAASATAYVVRLGPYETWVDDSSPIYTGQINGIWASATGNARCTEVT